MIVRRAYFDHAATSWPKPPGVVEALVEFQNNCGAAAGRGAYASSLRSSSIVERVRQQLSKLIKAGSPSEIAFVHNGTAALNLALGSFLKPGDHVVTTAAEHNSLLRPLFQLKQQRSIDFTITPVDSLGRVDPKRIEEAMVSSTRLIAVTHASNVTGIVQPLAEISEIVQRRKLHLLVDAAQTIGYLPINVRDFGIDFLAAPGHKGAAGLLGTAFLYASKRVQSELNNPWPGGTGTDSDQLDGPYAWPTGFETGNLNIPAIAAWSQGLTWLEQKHLNEANQLQIQQRARLAEILCRSNLGEIIGSDDAEHSRSSLSFVPVVSMKVRDLACTELAGILDSSFGIEARSGLHCAGAIHRFLGTDRLGGTLRFSLGHTTTDDDFDQLEDACQAIARQSLPST
jgi:cysteine desulfurase / selenocysteine lyase